MVPMLAGTTNGDLMGAFWELIQIELDRERFTVSDRKLAMRLNVSPSTIANWRAGFSQLPSERNLRAVADFTGRSYEQVLLAALSETGHARGTRLERRNTIAHQIRDELIPPRPEPEPPPDDDQSGDAVG